jgi:hypothetical protein
MTASDTKSIIGDELKKQLLDKSLSWDRFQEISESVVSVLGDDLNEVDKKILANLSMYKELQNVILKINT